MANEAEFTSPLGDGELLFRSMDAREELGRLPEYRIELLRPTKDTSKIKPTDLLGQKVGVKIQLPDGWRYINGIATRFETGGVVGRFDLYHIEMRTWLWYLTLASNVRIFQDKTAVEIIDTVFDEYSSVKSVEKKLTGSFSSRPYTVQYRESDFDFISRLMEEEGIYYYFKHTQGTHKLVLCNSPTGHEAIPGGGSLRYATQKADMHLKDDVINQWRRARSVRSLKYSHTDFAAEAPTKSLLASSERSGVSYAKPNPAEVYDYPGGHDDSTMMTNTGTKVPSGERSAKFRTKEMESGHDVAVALTAHRELAVGYTFNFTEHDEDNGGYLVTSSIFQLEYAGYEANADDTSTSYSCRFDAVPKAVAFLPQPSVPAPLVHGSQTAIVVGPAGDEIHTDKYGRVKVKFHWDRDPKKNEKSSCWLRVSQPWAGKGFGFISLPRIGDEVVVSFLEGNPDRPLITGRVYNGDNMPPYALPEQATVTGMKSRSSKSGAAANANELRFDDKKGSEYVLIQAEKDYRRTVKNDSFDTIGNNHDASIAKNMALEVGENVELTVGKKTTVTLGDDTVVSMGADLNLEVSAGMGLDVTKGLDLKVGEALALSTEAAMHLDAATALNMAGGTSVSLSAGMSLVLDGGMSLTIKAGGSSIVLGADGVSITGLMVKINSGGSPGSANKPRPARPPKPKKPRVPAKNKDPIS